MSPLTNHLTQMVDMLASIGQPALLERFVLRNGKVFTKGPRGKLPMMTPKQCFANATESRRRAGPYVEGFVMRSGLPIPVHHAWNARDGQAVDLTLRPPLDPKFDGLEYLGVELTDEQVDEALRQTGYYGALLGPAGQFNTRLMFAIDPSLKVLFDEFVSAVAKNNRVV